MGDTLRVISYVVESAESGCSCPFGELIFSNVGCFGHFIMWMCLVYTFIGLWLDLSNKHEDLIINRITSKFYVNTYKDSDVPSNPENEI